MADDPYARIAQLEAVNAALRAENAALAVKHAAALERQAATNDIFRLFASSPAERAHVLETIVETAAQLLNADSVNVTLAEGESLRGLVTFRPATGLIRPSDERPGVNFPDVRMPLDRGHVSGRAILERQTIHVTDMALESDDDYPISRDLYRRLGNRTVLSVPLVRDGVAVGALSATQRPSPRPFSAEQIALLETFADQAVIAIENARLFEELNDSNASLREALEQQTATAEILRVIASSPTQLDAVLETIVQSAARLCESDDVQIHLVQNDAFVTKAHVGPMGPRFGFPLLTRDTIPGRAVLDREIVNVEDLAAIPSNDLAATFLRQLGVRSALAAPMLRDGVAIGSLTFLRLVARRFTEEQIALIETFADQAVIAIENARLFSELRESNRQVTEALEQQTITADVLRVIASSPTDLQRVLDTITESAVRLCDGDTGGMQEVRGEIFHSLSAYGDAIIKVTERQSDPAVREAMPRVVPTSFSGRATLERRTLHIPDVRTAVETEFPGSRGSFSLVGHRSQVVTPLMVDGEPIGVLTVQRFEQRPFTDTQIRLLETFADQAVIAIENARLFEELQEANRQLAEASQHKSQFLANMSHELRTPLNAIIGYSEMLQEEAEDLAADAFLPDLVRINGAGKHLLGLINDILDLSKIEAGRMDLFLETFEIGRMVQDVESIVQPLLDKNANTLVVSCPADPGTMRADQTKVRQALFNLLSNAAKFTDHGTISLTVRREPDWLTFAVRDTGIGMTEEHLGRLFEAFSQAEASTRSQYGGTGLGLAISRHFCRLMGGDLTVESAYGEGSTFTVRLPTRVPEPAAATSE